MKIRDTIAMASWLLFWGMTPAVAGDGGDSFPLSRFKNLVKQRVEWTGARDTISERVPKGESCVEAATERAIELGYVIRHMQARGEFGDYKARVGTRSGWNPGIGSLHTYTVVEILDSNDQILYTLDVDNYMGPIYISHHAPIHWDSEYVNLIEEVPSWNPSDEIKRMKEKIETESGKPDTAGRKNPFLGTWSGSTWCANPAGDKHSFQFDIWMEGDVIMTDDHSSSNKFHPARISEDGRIHCSWYRDGSDASGSYHFYVDERDPNLLHGFENTSGIRCKLYEYELRR